MTPVIITSGEPAGVGPELCVQIQHVLPQPSLPVVVFGDSALLQARAKLIGLEANWQTINSLSEAGQPGWYLMHHACDEKVEPGNPTSQAAAYVLGMLDAACDACLEKAACAMVTAPIQKSVLTSLQPDFQGHTEYLATRCHTDQVVMMLAGGGLKVALATTHIPLSKVSSALTQQGLTETLKILLADLASKWKLQTPRVLVTGLNPHAGESSTMGTEDIDVISPVIKHFQSAGHDVKGPYPADTLFQPKYLDQADAVLAMYHDQGLPVLKYASFGKGVNITLGLPITRTSVDHGTALDMAGTGKASVGSLMEALTLAINLATQPNQEKSE